MILPPGFSRFSSPFLRAGGNTRADRRASGDSGERVLDFLDEHLA
jgi:hypothetical protein